MNGLLDERTRLEKELGELEENESDGSVYRLIEETNAKIINHVKTNSLTKMEPENLLRD